MTLVPRPVPPVVNRPQPEVPAALGVTCVCKDPDLDRVRELMAAGWSQHDASLLVWAPEQLSSAVRAAMDHRSWATAFVRLALVRRLPWLRLPAPVEVS